MCSHPPKSVRGPAHGECPNATSRSADQIYLNVFLHRCTTGAQASCKLKESPSCFSITLLRWQAGR
eukprot:scaffold130289_cov50-Tisochrysis_lutea.AAC.1